MKGGMVVQIRVNPKDCLGVLDCAEQAGIDVGDKSFASIVSVVLSSLIQVARDTRIIQEEEDGFQYANRMQPFVEGKSTKARKKYTEALLRNAQLGVRPPKLTGGSEVVAASEEGVDRDSLAVELQTLMDKQDNEEALTAEELNRYQYLNKVLFG